ncbi:ExeM/NucH family extracellular endonuclease [Thaumasiovibrio sp. DFM-14]|uniref:ExeM/NucH family extracellular endonuclease n=1 Tax=Thaumasiovibrio sp. DFM-14 TaxID=3384792 RepID=UPI0039A2F213
MKLLKLSAISMALITSHASADVFISQLIYGATNGEAAIEIANTGNQAVTLDGYELRRAYFSTTNDLDLSGLTINPQDVIVLADERAPAGILNRADETYDDRFFWFASDAPISLVDASGNKVDHVGWEYGDYYKPRPSTLVRGEGEWQASTEYNPKGWVMFDGDDYTHLGGLIAPGDGETPPDGNVPEPDYDYEFSIEEIQGHSFSSPHLDKKVKVTGVITHIHADSGPMTRGFYIQQESPVDECASSGLFVYNYNTNDVEVGDKVDVYGVVTEYYGATQISGAQYVPTGETGIHIEPTPLRVNTTCTYDDVNEADNFEITLERHENMLVEFDQDAEMIVSRTFGTDFSVFRANMVASYKTLNFHPNQHHVPGSPESHAVRKSNEQRRVIIESPKTASNGVIPWYPNFGVDDGTGATPDYIRVGATFDGLQGIIGYMREEYRMFVTNEADENTFDHTGIERTDAPDVKEGDIKIGAFNVLNYFTSPFGGANNPLQQNRGADNYEDFDVQGAKLASAMLAIDADIWSFLEVENNGYDYMSSITELVRMLNDELPEEKQYVAMRDADNKIVGTDAIATMLVFRPTVLSLEEARIINLPEQHVPPHFWPAGVEAGSAYQRHAMTGIFRINGTDEVITLASNHFKSKGSECWEDYDQETGEYIDDDYQGSCENFRVSAAYQLAEELEKIDGHKIILGDLNSYAQEDPILMLTDTVPAGYEIRAARNTFVNGKPLHGNENPVIHERYNYIDIIAELHPDGFSYSYNDEVGNLDYTLISPSLRKHVVDATEWNINSRESTLFEYPTQYTGKFEKFRDPYRSSDHDPAVLTLDFLPEVKKGEYVALPDNPIGMPSDNNPIEGEKLTTVIDLTAAGRSSLQTGEIVQAIISDRSYYDVVTYSRSNQKVLTEADIKRGWVALDLYSVQPGENRLQHLIDGRIVMSRSVDIEEEKPFKHGGALNIFALITLMAAAALRRRVRVA